MSPLARSQTVIASNPVPALQEKDNEIASALSATQ
jgi:hypothetical protein